MSVIVLPVAGRFDLSCVSTAVGTRPSRSLRAGGLRDGDPSERPSLSSLRDLVPQVAGWPLTDVPGSPLRGWGVRFL